MKTCVDLSNLPICLGEPSAALPSDPCPIPPEVYPLCIAHYLAPKCRRAKPSALGKHKEFLQQHGVAVHAAFEEQNRRRTMMAEVPLLDVLSHALDATNDALSLLEIAAEKASEEEQRGARELIENAQAALHASQRWAANAADDIEGNEWDHMVPESVEEEARATLVAALRTYLAKVYPKPPGATAPTTQKEEAELLIQRVRKCLAATEANASPERCAEIVVLVLVDWCETWGAYNALFPLNTPPILKELFRLPTLTDDDVQQAVTDCLVVMDQATGGNRGEEAIIRALRRAVQTWGIPSTVARNWFRLPRGG